MWQAVCQDYSFLLPIVCRLIICWGCIQSIFSLSFVGDSCWRIGWVGGIPDVPLFTLTCLLVLSKSSTKISPGPSTSPEGGCGERWKCLPQIHHFLFASLFFLHLTWQVCWAGMVCESIPRQSMPRQLAGAEHRCVDRLQINSHTALAQVACHFRRGGMGKWEENCAKKKYSGTFLNRPLTCNPSSLVRVCIRDVSMW